MLIKLDPKTAREMLESAKVENRMSPALQAELKKHKWTFGEYAMDKKIRGITISLEFCIGDFCVGVYSKKGKWLLEKKVSCPSFAKALTQALVYESQIKSGKHWKGENN